MKVEFKVNSRTTVVAEGETQLEVFENLATMQEVFGEEKCGKCGGGNLNFRVRHVEQGKQNFAYPEMTCKDCWAKLSFGQSMDKTLFPIRHERDGKEYVKGPDGKNVKKGVNGWVKFNKDTNKEE